MSARERVYIHVQYVLSVMFVNMDILYIRTSELSFSPEFL